MQLLFFLCWYSISLKSIRQSIMRTTYARNISKLRRHWTWSGSADLPSWAKESKLHSSTWTTMHMDEPHCTDVLSFRYQILAISRYAMSAVATHIESSREPRGRKDVSKYTTAGWQSPSGWHLPECTSKGVHMSPAALRRQRAWLSPNIGNSRPSIRVKANAA